MGSFKPRKCPRCGYWHILGEPCQGKDAERILREAGQLVADAEARRGKGGRSVKALSDHLQSNLRRYVPGSFRVAYDNAYAFLPTQSILGRLTATGNEYRVAVVHGSFDAQMIAEALNRLFEESNG